MKQPELREIVEAVREVFPQAECTGLNVKQGFCIFWPTQAAPVIATGQHPSKAWKNAYKLIKGKNKKSLERLRQSLLGKEIKKGHCGAGY